MITGNLNRRITLQSRTQTRDALGGRSEAWTEDFKAWAELMSDSQVEKVVGESDRAATSRHFKIHWRNDIDARDHRVLYGGQTYAIKGIKEIGIKTGLVLSCENVEALTT